jgi:hypothetical protein
MKKDSDTSGTGRIIEGMEPVEIRNSGPGDDRKGVVQPEVQDVGETIRSSALKVCPGIRVESD